MHFFVVSAVVACVSFVVSQEQYSTRYDYVDLISILQDERSFHGYVNCLLDEGPCSPEGRFLKNTLPDALETNCRKCSSSQRKLVKVASHFVIDNFPAYWDKLIKKYDPNHKYQKAFMAFLMEGET